MIDESNCSNHTPSPDAYPEWHIWASMMSKRHRQVECPDCGLFAIWVKRDPDEPDYGGDLHLKQIAEGYQ